MAKKKNNEGIGIIGQYFIWLPVSAVLVFGTYNESGFSLSHWLLDLDYAGVPGALKIICIILLVMAYSYLFWASLRSLKVWGKLGIIALVTAFGYLAFTLELINLRDLTTYSVALQIMLVAIFSFGAVGSKVNKKLFAHYDTDEAK